MRTDLTLDDINKASDIPNFKELKRSRMVEHSGLEPLTSSLPARRSPS